MASEPVTACGFCEQGVWRGQSCPYCDGTGLAPQSESLPSRSVTTAGADARPSQEAFGGSDLMDRQTGLQGVRKAVADAGSCGCDVADTPGGEPMAKNDYLILALACAWLLGFVGLIVYGALWCAYLVPSTPLWWLFGTLAVTGYGVLMPMVLSHKDAAHV